MGLGSFHAGTASDIEPGLFQCELNQGEDGFLIFNHQDINGTHRNHSSNRLQSVKARA